MGDKILQWNVCGFQANCEELLLLTRFYQPCVLALQETLQSDCSETSLSGTLYYIGAQDGIAPLVELPCFFY